MRERALELCIMVEAYAKVTGERPAAVFVSIRENEVIGWTWKKYLGFFRKGYDRLESMGVMGGIRFFHPFRIRKNVLKLLREVGYGSGGSKGGFWAGVRENALKLGSWRSYLRLSPHLHAVVFPSCIDEHRRKDIVVRKYAVLATTEDLVAHVQYLLSHCGILADRENEPAKEFGNLSKFVPEKFLTDEELKEIRNRVKKAMGMKVDREGDEIPQGEAGEEAGEEEDPYQIEWQQEKKKEYTWIPIWQFSEYSAEQVEWISAFLSSIPKKEHRAFIADIIDTYNRKRTDSGLKTYERNVFIEDLGSCPDGFELVDADWGDIGKDEGERSNSGGYQCVPK